MTFQSWALYSLIIFISTMTPGSSVLLLFNHGVRYGPCKSLGSAFGIMISALIMATISVLSLSVLLGASTFIFLIIKYLGAGYLIYIGIKTWTATNAFNLKEVIGTTNSNVSMLNTFQQGVLTGLSNPKAMIFFTALFPQFIDKELSQHWQYFILALTLAILVFICMMIYALIGNSLRIFFYQGVFFKWFNRVTGGLFVSIGASLGLAE